LEQFGANRFPLRITLRSSFFIIRLLSKVIVASRRMTVNIFLQDIDLSFYAENDCDVSWFLDKKFI